MAKEWAKWFYNSDAWKSTRKAVLLACGYTCELCGGHAEEVHHEIELTPENIRDPAATLNPQLLHPLCGNCHKLVTKRQKQKRKADCDSGYCFDADGNLTPRGMQFHPRPGRPHASPQQNPPGIARKGVGVTRGVYRARIEVEKARLAKITEKQPSFQERTVVLVEFSHIYTTDERRQMLDEKRKEFTAILTKIPGKKKKAARAIAAQAAFLAVAVGELDEIVMRDGYVEEYQNGENQWGTKKTVAADLLDRYTKTYTTAIRQIVDLLPDEEARQSAKDELTEFMRRRPGV